MTPEQESELIEKMARAMCAEMQPSKDPDELGPAPRGTLGLLPFWYRGYGRQARAALSIAKPIIRDEALEEAALAAEGFGQKRLWVPGSLYETLRREVASRIRALKSKGQKP